MSTHPDQGSAGSNRPTGRLGWSVIRQALFSLEDESAEAGDPFFKSWEVEALKDEAAELEQRGAMGAAQRLRDQVAFLEPLLDPGGTERQIYLWELEGMDWPHLSVLSWMAQDDGKALEVLSMKAHHYVGQLARLAQAGNQAAAGSLVALAKFTTHTIQTMATGANAEMLQPAFGQEFVLPVLMSPHPHLGADAEQLAEAVKLGSALPFRVDAKARVNPTDDAGRIAWKLWWYVNRTRNVARFFYARSLAASRHEGGWEKYLKESMAQRRQARRSEESAPQTETTETQPPEHPKSWSELEEDADRLFRQSERDRLRQKEERTKASQGAPANAPEEEWTIEEEAALLEDFGQGSARQWWSVARRCLLEAYPSADSPGEVNEAVPALSRLVESETDRQTPGRFRARILEKLASKFCGLARSDPP